MSLPFVTALLAALAALLVLARRAAPAGRIDLTTLVFIRAPFNKVAFWLRSHFGPSRREAQIVNEPKEALFDYLPDRDAHAATMRALDLEQRFDLHALRSQSTREVYRHNLYVLDLLDRHVTPHLDRSADALRAIDAGSQDFRYATALERWLRHAATLVPRDVALDGIEIDGHGLYPDLSTRAAHAALHAALTDNPNVRYRVEDFCETEDQRVDVVFAWFPFVLAYALVRWGLPLDLFAPERFFRRAADALAPGGLLVVVTHTEEERAALDDLLRGNDALEVIERARAESPLIHYFDDVPERAVTIARRRPDSSLEAR